MNELLKSVEDVLSSFENFKESFDEHDVAAKLRSCIPNETTEISESIRGDIIAFDFCENAVDHASGWGLYFGPKFVFKNEDGSVSESPSRSFINKNVLDLWMNRAKTLTNPILIARYSSLVWVFGPQILGQSPGIEFARLIISSIIKISQDNCYKREVYISNKLEWALSISLSIKDESLQSQVVSAILSYEDKIAKDDKPGLWGFSFDLLLLNKRIKLLAGTEEKIVSDLEKRLARITAQSQSNDTNPWAAESAATRLARYYQVKGNSSEVKRVLCEYSKCFQGMIEKAAPLQALVWTQQISKVFLDFGVRDESNKLLAKIKEIGPKVKEDLKEIKVETTISKEKIDEYFEEMLEGDIEKCLARIAFRFIPRKGEVEDQLKRNSEKSIFQHIIPQSILDHKGRTVAVVGTIEEDFPGHILLQTSQNMSFSAYFLRLLFDKLISEKNATPKDFNDFVLKSPVFDVTKKSIIETGINAFFEGNDIVAIHLLVPQVEDAIRNLIEDSGGFVMKFNKNHWIQVKTFDELLRDEIIESALGEDCALYFRVLFTDSRGWNIRNNVCHGLSPIEAFSRQVSDRIIHSLLFLGILRKKSTTSNSTED